jgi:cytochrome oxidase Cu insertion factor (SCO1/SenC/PrrC family)
MKRMRKQLTYVLTALLALVVGVAAWRLTPVAVTPRVESKGIALIGGPFALTDDKGRPRASADFRGRFMLIYFGFTTCPDICPTELGKMTAALTTLEKTAPDVAAKITPIFITIDPERDTVTAMASYVENFHPRFIGLTGNVAQIKAVQDAYKVYARKAYDKDTPETYLMDHSSFIYLMGPDGNYITHYTIANTADMIAKNLPIDMQE